MSDTAESQTKRAWVERILGFSFPEAVEVAGDEFDAEAIPPDETQERTEFQGRVRDLIIQGSLLPEPHRAEFLVQARSVEQMVATATLETVADEIEALEDARTQAGKVASIEEALRSIKGSVQYRKMQIAWRDAQNAAAAELDRFIAAVLADPEIQEDELHDQVVAATDNAAGLVPRFGGELADLLDQLDVTVDADARAALTREANEVIGSYSAALDDSDGLRELQRISDSEYSGISFFSKLQDALRDMQAAIA